MGIKILYNNTPTIHPDNDYDGNDDDNDNNNDNNNNNDNDDDDDDDDDDDISLPKKWAGIIIANLDGVILPKMLSVNLIGNNGKVSVLLLIKGINFPIIWINNGNANMQPLGT